MMEFNPAFQNSMALGAPMMFAGPNALLFNQHKPKIGKNNGHKMIKTKWTPEEDKFLTNAVEQYGTNNWTLIATKVPGRTGKQCRERWTGQVCPTISKVSWTQDEDMILFQYQRLFGNKWAKIAQYLPNRSPISVKNRWNWYARHKNSQLMQQSLSNTFVPTAQPSSPVVASPPPVVEKIRFEPISQIDCNLFGEGFEEFKNKMFGNMVY